MQAAIAKKRFRGTPTIARAPKQGHRTSHSASKPFFSSVDMAPKPHIACTHTRSEPTWQCVASQMCRGAIPRVCVRRDARLVFECIPTGWARKTKVTHTSFPICARKLCAALSGPILFLFQRHCRKLLRTTTSGVSETYGNEPRPSIGHATAPTHARTHPGGARHSTSPWRPRNSRQPMGHATA